MNDNRLLCLLLAVALTSTACARRHDVADYVNPFIGASTNVDAAGAYHGLGKTFPGAATPYGMVQVSPQTITGGDNGSGYSYEHTTIEGFSMTQMSGVGWNGDLGNFTVMPTTGPLHTVAGLADGSVKGWRSRYDKATETAQAGYYSVVLTDYGIRVETSATTRCGILRFTFPKNERSRIQVDLARRVGGTASWESCRVVDDHTIEGRIECTPDGGGWGDGLGHARYTLYYHATFSRPLTDHGFWTADIPDGQSRHLADVTSKAYLERVAKARLVRGKGVEGRHVGFFTEFPTAEGEQVEMQVGVSFVDLEGARNNYRQEMDGLKFDEVRARAHEAWNAQLGKIEVEGGTIDDKTVFYTALYHTMIDPRVYQDCDGRYVGGDYRVHPSDGTFTKRTVFSGWDVFRSQFPLQTIINPTLVGDMLASLTTMADQSGRHYFERWELMNAYSGCMLGNPALSVLADAWAKGICGYDIAKAYEYAKNSSARFGNDSLGYTPGSLGISYTLEYAYTDWCLSRLAEMLGKKADAKVYRQKSRAWRNLFDRDKGWFRPRWCDGSWMEWPKEGRLKEWYGCMECDPLQQGWFVPHDVKGMTRLMGGRRRVLADLEWMFEQTPGDLLWNVYYNHANEPVHFVPYLFNRLGRPWLTQKWTRFVCAHAYHNRVEGIVGNEDVGQMSAWYVLSAIGIHQYCPGDTRFEITSPVFSRVTVHLPGSRDFTVVADGNSPDNVYIQRATLDGKPYDKCHLDYSDIMRGATLHLTMGGTPDKKFGK